MVVIVLVVVSNVVVVVGGNDVVDAGIKENIPRVPLLITNISSLVVIRKVGHLQTVGIFYLTTIK